MYESYACSYFALISFLGIFSSIACSQPSLRPIAASDPVAVEYEFVGKKGETTKYSVKLSEIPKAPPVPDAYRPLPGRSYLIRTNLIAYGETIVSFTVPGTTEENFQKARILELVPNELSPSGYGWKDCTIKNEEWRDPQSEYISAERIARMRKFLPDYAQKRISCARNDDYFDKYLVLVTQTIQPPESPFTTLSVELADIRKSPGSGETIYRLSLKNTGTKEIAQLDFLSIFGSDSDVTSLKPSQGACIKSDSKDRGSALCHTGPLKAGATLTVEFGRIPSGMGNGEPPPPAGQPAPPDNVGWIIMGVMKETPNSNNWPTNYFQIQPLRKSPQE
jgi:hypothetical protein